MSNIKPKPEAAKSHLYVGRSTQWVLVRYHFTAYLKPDGSLDKIEGPMTKEVVHAK